MGRKKQLTQDAKSKPELTEGERMLNLKVGESMTMAYRGRVRPTRSTEITFNEMQWRATPTEEGLKVTRVS